ncbi:MBL fold metallo-hydrolase [Galbitalea sp. SE-J8]|uniref:MBL fold metallo-hydrolase n=1 Tax=Galbitalea sp. SE-J8 TaxID=3054952 RepID=UPI00259D05FE|nr:MBL fold metallo-hydrolase [Galbitalea sp. SE-J8]MDM4763651.1 MBL fold metallo-hydrolase [Galbitalea sp. SE-J8]
MKVTKLEHACLLVEIDDAKLVIDPGSFTVPLADPTGVVAVVITHEHADHWTPDHLARITRASPDARIFGAPGVVAAADGFEVTPTHDGDTVEVGPFTLRFAGTTHAVIHSSVPTVDNVGVLVNDTLFYPGDAFTVPPFEVDTLAAPVGAPWLKVGEAMDYVSAVAPKRAFPTHSMTLSKAGFDMQSARLAAMTDAAGGDFRILEPGESIEL